MKATLSRTQRRVYQFIRAYHQAHGFAPTVREIADGVGFMSFSTSNYVLTALHDKGIIRRQANTSRGIALPPDEPRGMTPDEQMLNDQIAAMDSPTLIYAERSVNGEFVGYTAYSSGVEVARVRRVED